MSKTKIKTKILAANTILLLMLPFELTVAATIFWSKEMYVSQRILPPVDVSVKSLTFSLNNTYGGQTQFLSKNNGTAFSFLGSYLTIRVYVIPKTLRLTLLNQSALAHYYSLFNATLSETTSSLRLLLGFGGTGLANPATLQLTQARTYVFDLTFLTTTLDNINVSVTVNPAIKCEVSSS